MIKCVEKYESEDITLSEEDESGEDQSEEKKEKREFVYC